MENAVLHLATSRGHANHGWLDSNFSFSFANYYNPERMHFGALRVLNDDIIAGGMGFGTHPHDNMEIVSIGIEGDLEHKDSMGNTQVIASTDVQIMSAGTGVQHSERNKNAHEQARFLQIWVFPKYRNIKPRYDQRTFPIAARRNKLLTVVAPDSAVSPISELMPLKMNQDAWFSLGSLDAKTQQIYTLNKKENGVYAFIIEGSATVNGQKLDRRDALGLSNISQLTIETIENTEILLMEVPMNI
jgi:redox-sensitive bicupin YhaK (pirin superfamily)